MLVGLHEGVAEIVERLDFGGGEGAVVDADVVDGVVEHPRRHSRLAISTAAGRKPGRYCDCCGTQRIDGRWPLTWE
jgi:hypothetical protein